RRPRVKKCRSKQQPDLWFRDFVRCWQAKAAARYGLLFASVRNEPTFRWRHQKAPLRFPKTSLPPRGKAACLASGSRSSFHRDFEPLLCRFAKQQRRLQRSRTLPGEQSQCRLRKRVDESNRYAIL